MNFVEIAGHLGADAEERSTATGRRVITLRLAAKSRPSGKDKDKDETIWWRVTIWGDRFDKMIPYLRKGVGIIVFGEMMKPETYVDKMGQTQVSLNVTADVIRFSPFGKTGSREGEERPFQSNQQRQEKSFDAEPVGAGVGEDNIGYTGDDLPF